MRWQEEVTLITEEMRRVLWFARWKKNWWIARGELREDERLDIKEGLVAYAAKQAAVWEKLATNFAEEWYPLLVAHSLPTDWPEEYLERWVGMSGDKSHFVVDGDGDDDGSWEDEYLSD
jgi:hypothetical protein